MKHFTRLFMALMLFSLMSCLSTKKVTDSTLKQTEKTEVIDVRQEKTVTSGAIKDEITINVPESSNPAVTKELISLIKRMQSSKSSGGNGYQLYYDEKLKALKLRIEIAETQNRDTNALKSTTTDNTFEESVNEYIRKTVIPWWGYAILLFFIRKEIFWLVTKAFPALNVLNIFKGFKGNKYTNPRPEALEKPITIMDEMMANKRTAYLNDEEVEAIKLMRKTAREELEKIHPYMNKEKRKEG